MVLSFWLTDLHALPVISVVRNSIRGGVKQQSVQRLLRMATLVTFANPTCNIPNKKTLLTRWKRKSSLGANMNLFEGFRLPKHIHTSWPHFCPRWAVPSGANLPHWGCYSWIWMCQASKKRYFMARLHLFNTLSKVAQQGSSFYYIILYIYIFVYWEYWHP